ncbi:MAG: aldehyde dehydrogenase [Saprospiraceae bacterium]|nr:aldehyde dehydrogenase [Saprospiraceae bacterium]
MKKILHFIDGEYSNPVSDLWIEGINPATGEIITQISNGDVRDVEKAFQAATRAFSIWSNYSSTERFQILNRIAELIEENLEELAIAETIDTGKPLRLSKEVEIPRAASNFRFFATASLQFASESHSMNQAINYTLRQAIGVVGCISPWNLPLYLFTWKIAPALATGNCVIAKPSEMSPSTAAMLGELCNKAGLPKGVLNILQGEGKGVGNAIVNHPGIKAISFTGGTKTGQHISAIAGPMFKKLSLELGGKNPCLVFDDCNLELTVSEVARLAFSNQGQICLCGSRILIEETIYEEFKNKLIEKVSKLIVGDPLDPKTQFGSLISFEHKKKVQSYIQLAIEEGGNLLYGGNEIQLEGRCKNGSFISPAIFENLGPKCRTNQEEIFGPVITLQKFKGELEAIELANDSVYGLAATVWTENVRKAHRVAQKLNTGIVWINCWLLRDLRTPFGGMNASGVGREGGLEAMRFFTEAKNVCVYYN